MKRVYATVAAAVLVYALVASVWDAVSGPLDHDEHQFMASAFMVARYGFHPYRDFAYFHMPNLVYWYAPFFLVPYSFTLKRLQTEVCRCGHESSRS